MARTKQTTRRPGGKAPRPIARSPRDIALWPPEDPLPLNSQEPNAQMRRILRCSAFELALLKQAVKMFMERPEFDDEPLLGQEILSFDVHKQNRLLKLLWANVVMHDSAYREMLSGSRWARGTRPLNFAGQLDAVKMRIIEEHQAAERAKLGKHVSGAKDDESANGTKRKQDLVSESPSIWTTPPSPKKARTQPSPPTRRLTKNNPESREPENSSSAPKKVKDQSKNSAPSKARAPTKPGITRGEQQKKSASIQVEEQPRLSIRKPKEVGKPSKKQEQLGEARADVDEDDEEILPVKEEQTSVETPEIKNEPSQDALLPIAPQAPNITAVEPPAQDTTTAPVNADEAFNLLSVPDPPTSFEPGRDFNEQMMIMMIKNQHMIVQNQHTIMRLMKEIQDLKKGGQ